MSKQPERVRKNSFSPPLSREACWRLCCKCDKSFFSAGFGNRLCTKCNIENSSISVRVVTLKCGDGQDA